MNYFERAWNNRSWPHGMHIDLRARSVWEVDGRMLQMGARNVCPTACKFVDCMDIFSDPNAATSINGADSYQAWLFLSLV